MSSAPQSLTMDRLGEMDDIILGQSTSMCCRCCCFQPSINWVIAEGNDFEPGSNPFTLETTGWIHEESTWCQRTWSWILPGCRAIRYVQHSGSVPQSLLQNDNAGWFTCQRELTTVGLEEDDMTRDIIGFHEKKCTCGYCFNFGDIQIPICNFFPLPYLETQNADGTVVGKTQYICDLCMFVPKYDILDANDDKKYRLRPDTCCLGCCVVCRCGGNKGGKKGKCFRIPFIIRDPVTYEPIETNGSADKSQIDVLWSGWKNECCTQKNAYHIAFPKDSTAEERLLLMGSTLLVDVTMFEQKEDDN